MAISRVPERSRGERLFEVAADVYRIPLPTDFPVGDVNVYFLDGRRPALVDTGVRGEASVGELSRSLGTLGRRLEDIRLILVTHTHVDHAGAAHAIQGVSGCEVRVHARGHRRLADVEAWFEHEGPWFASFFRRSGISAEVLERYTSVSRLFLRYTESCPRVESVRDGEALDLGERTITAHETFGHTTSHVVYSLGDAQVVFTGDHLLPEITANPTLEAPDPGDPEKPRPLVLYRESLARLAAMPLSFACPGHGPPFADVGARCREVLAHQRERVEKVYQLLRANGRMTRRELSLALFGRVTLFEIYLTLSEVQAAVELLEAEGRALVIAEEEVDWIEARELPAAGAR
jgi:glyoxylase-like metal-dependent hydrolase (beta-lactamase superfamily II)